MREKIKQLERGDKFSVNSVNMIKGESKKILDRVFEVKNIGEVSDKSYNSFLSELFNLSNPKPFVGSVLKDDYDEEHYMHIPRGKDLGYILISENSFTEKPENEIGEIHSIRVII